MRRAIAIPYCIDQHEPSKPLRQLVELDDDLSKNEDMLKTLFCETVCDGIPHDELTISEGELESFGDVVVSSNDDSLFLFLTYID